MRIRTALVAVVMSVLLLAGCEVINPEEDLPAYLALHYPTIVQPSGDTVRTGVDNIWLFQGGNLHGTFPVQPEAPTVIPTLDLETTNFTLAGGIFLAANAASSVQYPYWQADTAFRTLAARDTVHFYPTIKYWPDTILDYPVSESFEQGNSLEAFPDTYGGSNEVNYQVRAGAAFEGERYLEIRFTEDEQVMELWSDTRLALPRTGRVFAEVAYRGDIKFGMSLVRQEIGSSQGEILNIPFRNFAISNIPKRPYDRNQWQKIYFDFSGLIDESLEESDHYLYLLAFSDGSQRKLQIDSIRILHFQ